MRRNTDRPTDDVPTDQTNDGPTTAYEAKRSYDPARDRLAPDETDDGRRFLTVAWDGGIDDITATGRAHDTDEGSPVALVYWNSSSKTNVVKTGTIRVWTELTGYSNVRIETDDGQKITVRTGEGSDKVYGRKDRKIGVFQSLHVAESWDAYDLRNDDETTDETTDETDQETDDETTTMTDETTITTDDDVPTDRFDETVNRTKVAEGDTIDVAIPAFVRDETDDETAYLLNARVTRVTRGLHVRNPETGEYHYSSETAADFSFQCNGWKGTVYCDRSDWKLSITPPSGEYVPDCSSKGVYVSPTDETDDDETIVADGGIPLADLQTAGGNSKTVVSIDETRDFSGYHLVLETDDGSEYRFRALSDDEQYTLETAVKPDGTEFSGRSLPKNVSSVLEHYNTDDGVNMSVAKAYCKSLKWAASVANSRDDETDETTIRETLERLAEQNRETYERLKDDGRLGSFIGYTDDDVRTDDERRTAAMVSLRASAERRRTGYAARSLLWAYFDDGPTATDDGLETDDGRTVMTDGGQSIDDETDDEKPNRTQNRPDTAVFPVNIPSFETAKENGTVVERSGYHQPNSQPYGRGCTVCTKTTEKGAYRDVSIEYDGMLIHYYHQSPVVVQKGRKYRLDSHGYRTSTTKERINRYVPARVYQEDYKWYVSIDDETDLQFTDGMVIDGPVR